MFMELLSVPLTSTLQNWRIIQEPRCRCPFSAETAHCSPTQHTCIARLASCAATSRCSFILSCLSIPTQVVEEGTTTQLSAETSQDVAASSTEPAVNAGPPSGTAARAMKTKVISPGGASQKPFATRQETKLSATPQTTPVRRADEFETFNDA